MLKIKSIRQVRNLKNKTILVRCDFDVPIENNKVVDDTRLKACVPTIKYLLKKKVKKIILMGHLGRPGGKVVKNLSLEPVAKHLEGLLNKKIEFINKVIDYKLPITNYQLLMLENLRFNKNEKQNDKKWARSLAKIADIYVNESFANSHRAHASMKAIQNYLPSYAGLHLEQEIKNLSQILNKPKKPLILIIGGAKIETKLPVIKSFLDKADRILVGGAVANNFLKAKKMDVGKSLIDEKYLSEAEQLLKKSNHKIILPIDYKMQDGKILDIGPKTIILFNGIIKKAKTIIWSGPLGFFENEKFAKGTNEIAKCVLENKKAKVISGGGETLEAIQDSRFKIHDSKISISTGGGAMLEFLAGKSLPGLKKIVK